MGRAYGPPLRSSRLRAQAECCRLRFESWPGGGLASLGLSLFLSNWVLASIAGVFGFACLWTIRELHEQEQRVARGWFPRKPDRG